MTADTTITISVDGDGVVASEITVKANTKRGGGWLTRRRLPGVMPFSQVGPVMNDAQLSGLVVDVVED